MVENPHSSAAYLGFFLFGIFFLGLIVYILARSWRRSVQVALDSVRVKLRQLLNRLNDFRVSFQSFSPGDPEPFGSLVGMALDRLVGVELVLRGLFDRYAGIHEDVSRLRTTRDWNVIRLPVMWYRKRNELVNFATEIVKFESTLDDLLQYQERLAQMNSEVAKSSQAILQTSNQASSAFEKLYKLGLRGKSLERAREEIRNWQSTFLNQVPVIFFSTDSEIIRSQTDKDTTSRIHRLNQTAAPAVSKLLGEADEWNRNYHTYLELRDKLKEGMPDIQQIVDELARAPAFPVIWEQTKIRIAGLSKEVGELESLAANHDVADLSGLASEFSKLFEEMVSISERLVDTRSDHMELCSLSLSEEMANGPETLKSAYHLAESISAYHSDNFLRGDVVNNLSSDLKAVASLQGRFLRYSSASEVNENELSKRLELARGLALQYKSIAPRLQSIRKRLSEIQELERTVLSKLDELQQVATGLEALVQENPRLKKAVGTEPLKIKSQALGLSEELSQREKDTVEKKAERCQVVYARAMKDIEKWSDMLSGEIVTAHEDLFAQIGVLREIVWIDDPVMAEAEHLLTSTMTDNLPPASLSSLKEPLLNKFEQLVRSNDNFQRHAIALQRINNIAGPLLANYRQAERSRNAVNGMMSRLGEIFPQNEEAWPPTTIRIGSEQAKFMQLEKDWNSLKKERMKASMLAEKLSNLQADYKALEIQLEDGLNRVKQEQGRFSDYERRLEESRRMWRRVAANHTNNRFVSDGVTQLLFSVDQEIQRLRTRYLGGELNYSLALQGMKQICRKLDEGFVEIDQNQIIDINGESQRRL